MRAIILAAGSGLRLGQHTKDIPKALLDLNGKWRKLFFDVKWEVVLN